MSVVLPPSSGPIGPVYLVTEEPAVVVDSGAASTWGSAGLAVTGTVVAAAVAAWWVVRRRRRAEAGMDAAEVALRSLAWRLWLRRGDVRALRALGAAARVPGWPERVHPVALLVSRSAFETAAGAAGGSVEAQRIARLRRRVFGAEPGR